MRTRMTLVLTFHYAGGIVPSIRIRTIKGVAPEKAPAEAVHHDQALFGAARVSVRCTVSIPTTIQDLSLVPSHLVQMEISPLFSPSSGTLSESKMIASPPLIRVSILCLVIQLNV